MVSLSGAVNGAVWRENAGLWGTFGSFGWEDGVVSRDKYVTL